MAIQTGTEWLRALVEGADSTERIHGEWIEPPSPEVWADTIDRAQVAALGKVANRPTCDPPPWLFGASENPTPGGE